MQTIGNDPGARKALFKIERSVQDIRQRVQNKNHQTTHGPKGR